MILFINVDRAGAVAAEPSIPVPAGEAAPNNVLPITVMSTREVVAKSIAVVQALTLLNSTLELLLVSLIPVNEP